MANFFPNNTQTQQLSQRESLTNKYMSARHNLLLVVAFTLINIILLVANSNTYFLFSAYIPYLIVDLGMALCGKYPAEYYGSDLAELEFFGDAFFAVTLVVAAVFLVLYLLSWILSKKPRVGWMIFSLVFFIVDTAGMLLVAGISSDMIIDIVFHAWVVVSLIGGISAYFKLKKLPEEVEVPVFAEDGQSGFYQNSSILRIADTEGKARILLETEAAGYSIVYRRVKRVNELVINGNVYDEMEAFVEFAHTLRACVGGHVIEAGYDGTYFSFINVDGQQVAKKRRIF